MSSRTLQRELSARGTSYRALVDDVRRELAQRLLKSALSVTEIAFLVGFGSLASFERAFKLWTGVPPTRFRAGS